MIIYDCEIKKAIADENHSAIDGIEYCDGWKDFVNMGISCIGAYDYITGRYRVFCEDNFDEFQKLVDRHNVVVGFNSIAFDNRLLAANGISVETEKSYDILVAIWKGAGLSAEFSDPSHIGFGLDDVCKTNFGLDKTGHGPTAPVLWQQGKIGAVIDYCLNDVYLTKMLLDHIHSHEWIKDPRDATKKLCVRGFYSSRQSFDDIF